MDIFEPKLLFKGALVAGIEAGSLGNVGRAWKEGARGGNVATTDDAVLFGRTVLSTLLGEAPRKARSRSYICSHGLLLVSFDLYTFE